MKIIMISKYIQIIKFHQKIKTFERFDLNRNGNKKRLITFLTIYKFE